MHRALALLLPLSAAAAQDPVVSIDVGGARMRFADSINATAVSLSPAFRVAGALASLSASGTISRLSGATTRSGIVDAALSTRRRGAGG